MRITIIILFLATLLIHFYNTKSANDKFSLDFNVEQEFEIQVDTNFVYLDSDTIWNISNANISYVDTIKISESDVSSICYNKASAIDFELSSNQILKFSKHYIIDSSANTIEEVLFESRIEDYPNNLLVIRKDNSTAYQINYDSSASYLDTSFFEYIIDTTKIKQIQYIESMNSKIGRLQTADALVENIIKQKKLVITVDSNFKLNDNFQWQFMSAKADTSYTYHWVSKEHNFPLATYYSEKKVLYYKKFLPPVISNNLKDLNKVRCFPNPLNQQYLNIKLPETGDQKIKQITLFEATGKRSIISNELYDVNKNHIKLKISNKSFSKGLYTIKIDLESEFYSTNFIVL